MPTSGPVGDGSAEPGPEAGVRRRDRNCSRLASIAATRRRIRSSSNSSLSDTTNAAGGARSGVTLAGLSMLGPGVVASGAGGTAATGGDGVIDSAAAAAAAGMRCGDSATPGEGATARGDSGSKSTSDSVAGAGALTARRPADPAPAGLCEYGAGRGSDGRVGADLDGSGDGDATTGLGGAAHNGVDGCEMGGDVRSSPGPPVDSKSA
jgi:hypothetical protein